MFTGIVTEVGNVIAIADKGDKRVTVSCAMDPARIAIGASIACSGVCLTVVEKGGVVGEAWFAVDVSGETISRTAPRSGRQARRSTWNRRCAWAMNWAAIS
jgi:riboflavin synthase